MFTKTTADVMWKDGRLERGIRSNDLIPIQHLDSHEFCPGDFVVDKRRKRRTFITRNKKRNKRKTEKTKSGKFRNKIAEEFSSAGFLFPTLLIPFTSVTTHS